MTPDAGAAGVETLKNGLAVTIRDLRPDDRGRIAQAVRGLDPESIYTRLFSHRRELTETGLNRIMSVDPESEVALVVTRRDGEGETIVGSGRLILSGEGGERSGEVAFMVEEDYRGLGVASRVLAHLASRARALGAKRLEADVLAENASMLKVFKRSALPIEIRREGGTVHVTLTL